MKYRIYFLLMATFVCCHGFYAVPQVYLNGMGFNTFKLAQTQAVFRAEWKERVRRACCFRMDLSVTLQTPLGIIFEELEPNSKRGVVVASLLPGGNAELDGRILVGDKVPFAFFL